MAKPRVKRKLSKRDIGKIATEGYVLLRGYKKGPCIVVWCPFCMREHSHGSGHEEPFTPTGRSPHCPPKVMDNRGNWIPVKTKPGHYYIMYTEERPE